MNRTAPPPVLPILLLLLFAGAGAAAPWADGVPAGHWMSPFDIFEENVSLSLAVERVGASVNDTERRAALREWRDLLDALSAERSAERQDLEARYASGALTPLQFNRAMEMLREGNRTLEGVRTSLALQEGSVPGPPPPAPQPVTGLVNTTYEPRRLNWTWAEPATPYNRTEVYVNGVFIYSLLPGVTGFGLVRASPGTEYTLSLRVLDDRGVPSPWANHTSRTAPDPPPGNVTNLTVANRSRTHIHWSWTNPADGDYNHTEVYIDGKWRLNTRLSDYRVEDLSPGASVRIDLRAVDRGGQAGSWATLTSQTLPGPTPAPVASAQAPAASSCPRCEEVDCDSCDNGICYAWKVTRGEGKQEFTCTP